MSGSDWLLISQLALVVLTVSQALSHLIREVFTPRLSYVQNDYLNTNRWYKQTSGSKDHEDAYAKIGEA